MWGVLSLTGANEQILGLVDSEQKQNKTDNKKSLSSTRARDGQASNTENFKQETLYFRDVPKKKL